MSSRILLSFVAHVHLFRSLVPGDKTGWADGYLPTNNFGFALSGAGKHA